MYGCIINAIQIGSGDAGKPNTNELLIYYDLLIPHPLAAGSFMCAWHGALTELLA